VLGFNNRYLINRRNRLLAGDGFWSFKGECMSEKDELDQVGQPQSDDEQMLETDNSRDLEHQSNAQPPTDLPEAIGVRFSIWQILLLALISVGVLCSLILNIVSLIGSGGLAAEGLFSTDAVFVIFVLMLVSVLATASAFWMYYAKSVMLKDGPALVPEKWGMMIDKLTFATINMQESSSSALNKVIDQLNYQSDQADSLMNSFLTLQSALDTRDEEISRLKKGYDAVIFKRFLNRFIRVDRALLEIVDETPNGDNAKDMRYLNRLMEDALDECGVERFLPEIGSDFRQATEGVGDEPTVLNTDQINLDFTVASVDSAGYVIRGEGDLQVIVPAKVSIYRIQVSQSSEETD